MNKMDNDMLWDTLVAHRGHAVEIAVYSANSNSDGDEDIADVCLEDVDTNEVILDAELYTLAARDDLKYDDEEPLSAEEITGTLGEWLDRDSSGVPAEIMKKILAVYDEAVNYLK